MVKIKPFAGIRPPKELAAEVSSRPYDVLNSQEAKAEATERSLLHTSSRKSTSIRLPTSMTKGV